MGRFLDKCNDRLPELRKKVKLLILAFSIIYIAERGFSEVLYMQNKNRNRLGMNITGGNSIRLK